MKQNKNLYKVLKAICKVLLKICNRYFTQGTYGI